MASYILKCSDCEKEYMPSEVEYLCPACAAQNKEMQPLRGVLKTIYEYDSARKNLNPEKLGKRPEQNFARWKEILPVRDDSSHPPLITNFTPLRAAQNLNRAFGMNELYLKDDTVMPTASFKDRASALVVAVAREKGVEAVVTASTGNAATALAGQAASVGMKSVIFAPHKAPPAKLTQIAIFGGLLIPVKGTYDEAFELSIAASKEFGWYNRNTAYNPFTIEGKKTAALEIWEQMNFTVPDWVVVPTGDGVILAGIEKGFYDLMQMGFIEKMPRLAAIQAEGCSPIVRAWKDKKEIVPELKPKTIADSISVGVPRAGRMAMSALASTNGVAVAVKDEDILDAIALLGKTEGIFAEPAAATSIAGVKKLVQDGIVKRDEKIVALITGSGLKDISAASHVVEIPNAIRPNIEEVKRAISK